MSIQTAVEILETSLLGIVSFDSEVLRDKYKERFKIAKEMEKENMISFYLKGCDDTYGIDEPVEGYDRKEAEEYYNETFENS